MSASGFNQRAAGIFLRSKIIGLVRLRGSLTDTSLRSQSAENWRHRPGVREVLSGWSAAGSRTTTQFQHQNVPPRHLRESPPLGRTKSLTLYAMCPGYRENVIMGWLE